MKAVQLLNSDRTPSDAWLCGVCGRFGTKEICEQCCSCSECGLGDVNVKTGDYTGIHKKCWDKRNERFTAQRIVKAQKLETFYGPVYWDTGPLSTSEEHAETLDEFAERLQDELNDGAISAEDWPEWVFCTSAQPPAIFDIGDILQHVDENGFEKMSERLEGVDEFEKALNAFREKNKTLCSYNPDYSRVVRMPKPGAA